METSTGPAYKLTVADLLSATPSADGSAYCHRGVTFSRAWVQGVVTSVSADGKDLFLDDGTGILPLIIPPPTKKSKGSDKTSLEGKRLEELFPPDRSPVGAYVLAVGKVQPATGQLASTHPRVLRWRRLEDVSGVPDRESLWLLETTELWRDVLRRPV